MPVELAIEPSVPNQKFSTQLAGVEYVLDIHWNDRDKAWFMNIYDTSLDIIAGGLKLVIGSLIGARATDTRFPAGYFVVADLSGQRQDATLDNISTRVGVSFYTYVDVMVLIAKVNGL